MSIKEIVIDQKRYENNKKPRVYHYSFGTLAAIIPPAVKNLAIKQQKRDRFALEFESAHAERQRKAALKFAREEEIRREQERLESLSNDLA